MASLRLVRARVVRRSHQQDEPEAVEDAVQHIFFAYFLCGRILSGVPNVYGAGRDDPASWNPQRRE
jgi:hypothetical protein